MEKLIALSNLELHGELLDAIKSRVNYLNYNPSDEQIVALLRSICDQPQSGFTKAESHEVCEFLVGECERMPLRPDVRMLVDKALPDWLLFKQSMTEAHWRDLITSTPEEQLVTLRHETRRRPSRPRQIANERRIAGEIGSKYKRRAQRSKAWQEQTGKSEDAFYRRLREIDVE